MTTDAPQQREAGWYWLQDTAGWIVAELRYEAEGEWLYMGEWVNDDYLCRWGVKIGPRITPPSEPNEAVVERAARAMYETEHAYKDSTGREHWTWANTFDETRKYWRGLARAALAAMPSVTGPKEG